METNYISENIAELTQPNKVESHEKRPLYIVIDTNVFLSNLEIIEKAKDTTFKNYPRPFIVIPWTVIRVSIMFQYSQNSIVAKVLTFINF